MKRLGESTYCQLRDLLAPSWRSKRRVRPNASETSNPSRLSGVPCQVCRHVWSGRRSNQSGKWSLATM